MNIGVPYDKKLKRLCASDDFGFLGAGYISLNFAIAITLFCRALCI